MHPLTPLFVFILLVSSPHPLQADDFHLDSAYNKGTLRLEIDNDAVWNRDSNFSNGWSLQYHTQAHPSWKATRTPELLRWVGDHFPTLGDENAMVRFGHGIGQNMITPGDLSAPHPPEGDLPYAGTLTYSFNWQSFNPQRARILHMTAGVLGEEAMAEAFQKFVHKDLGMGEDPKGWDTQRDTEPLLNLAYGHSWRLGYAGEYLNDWAGHMFCAAVGYLGNLIAAAEMGLGFRMGWNIQEGFNAFPAPPGYGIFANTLAPKPAAASPHGVELILAGKVMRLFYSVIYDGSILTDADRHVEHEDFIFALMAGLNYHYYDLCSIRLALLNESDMLFKDALPQTDTGESQTKSDNSYGTLMIDLHF